MCMCLSWVSGIGALVLVYLFGKPVFWGLNFGKQSRTESYIENRAHYICCYMLIYIYAK